tara:strand:+ start:943 stop:1656 length:714 start_codon:yes stop_codon:yes gene_type:complete
MKTKKNKYHSRKRKPRAKSIKKKRKQNKHKKGGDITTDKRDIFIEKVAKQNYVPSNSSIIPYGYTREHLKEAFDQDLSEVGVDDLDILVRRITEKMSNESEIHHKRINNLSKLKNHINVIIMAMNIPQLDNNQPSNLTTIAFPRISRTDNTLSPISPISPIFPRPTSTMTSEEFYDGIANAQPGTITDSDDLSVILEPEANNTSSFFDLTPSQESINFESRQTGRRTPPPFPNMNSI